MAAQVKNPKIRNQPIMGQLMSDTNSQPKEPPVLEQRVGRVVTLTLNRPDRLNAISPEMLGLLRDRIQHCDADPDVGVIILTGAGKGFCSGGDINAMSQNAAMGYEDHLEYLQFAHQVPLAIRKCGKIVIGMINGPAIGAGLSLASVCDIRIAARRARFGTAFASVGLPGDLGITYSLIHTVGPSMARELLLSAEIFDANRALSIGLVNYVVDDGDLSTETSKIAEQYAEGPAAAFRLIKRNLLEAESSTFSQLLQVEAENQATALTTSDHMKAVESFITRRKKSASLVAE